MVNRPSYNANAGPIQTDIRLARQLLAADITPTHSRYNQMGKSVKFVGWQACPGQASVAIVVGDFKLQIDMCQQ
jgi:hypothetical protein